MTKERRYRPEQARVTEWPSDSIYTNATHYMGCTQCGAPRGFYCQRPSGRQSEQPHGARVQAYARLSVGNVHLAPTVEPKPYVGAITIPLPDTSKRANETRRLLAVSLVAKLLASDASQGMSALTEPEHARNKRHVEVVVAFLTEKGL